MNKWWCFRCFHKHVFILNSDVTDMQALPILIVGITYIILFPITFLWFWGTIFQHIKRH